MVFQGAINGIEISGPKALGQSPCLRLLLNQPVWLGGSRLLLILDAGG
jgi:hypothetical protein